MCTYSAAVHIDVILLYYITELDPNIYIPDGSTATRWKASIWWQLTTTDILSIESFRGTIPLILQLLDYCNCMILIVIYVYFMNFVQVNHDFDMK